MVKNLIKHGNSYAVIIDKPILDLLRITPGTPLELTSDGRSILLSPVRDSADGRAFEDAVDRLHARFAKHTDQGDQRQRILQFPVIRGPEIPRHPNPHPHRQAKPHPVIGHHPSEIDGGRAQARTG